MAQETQTKSFSYDVYNLLSFIWGKRKILITLTSTAFVISIIISLMIKPRFKSSVLMFPTAEISVSKTLIEMTGSSNEKDVLTFGNDIEAGRLLQILKSNQLIDHIIKKFNLFKYYNIDPSSKYPNTTLYGILGKNIKCRRTEYNSIILEVYDQDPKMAADIANEIAMYSDTIIYKVTCERAQEAYNIVLNEYNTSEANINYLTDTLNKMRVKYGITEFSPQSAELTRAYGKALINKDKEVIRAFEDKLAVLEKYGGEYTEYGTRLGWEMARQYSVKGKLAAVEINLKPSISNVFIVDKARKAEKKDSPKRSLIVFFSTISVFALSVLILVVAENIKSRI
jgi:uncharacterized protein involved in exopolysaccharide biosynthesis